MEIDAKLSSQLAELKTQLEKISGHAIEATPEQLIPLFFRVSLSSAEDATVMSRSIIFPGKTCTQASGIPASLFDVTSRSTTGANGKLSFLLSSFICSTINFFGEPVNVVVTPNADIPCYATMTHALVPNPNIPGSFSDLKINVSTWKPDGNPAGGINFDWRCRLLSFQTVL